MKFRIVQLVHRVGELHLKNGHSSIEYVIERKNFWGRWKEVLVTELQSRRKSHKTYEDAEAYMIATYMGHGMCRVDGCEYEYTPYTYFTM